MPGVKTEPSQASLLEAVDAGNLDTFLDLVQRQRTKKDQAELADAIKLLQRADLVRLGEYIHRQARALFTGNKLVGWSYAHTLWAQIAEALSFRSTEDSSGQDTDTGQQVRPPASCLSCFTRCPPITSSVQVSQVLKGAALVAMLMLQDHAQRMPEAMVSAVIGLHDNALLVRQPVLTACLTKPQLATLCSVLQAATDLPEVQEAVVKLCMAWWLANAPGREGIVPQTLPYLLVKALTSGAPGAASTGT